MATIEGRQGDQVHHTDEDRDVCGEAEEQGPIALRTRVADLAADTDEARRVGRLAGFVAEQDRERASHALGEDLRDRRDAVPGRSPDPAARYDRCLRERESLWTQREPD